MFLVHFENLGCRLNQSETEALASAFLNEGFLLFAKNKSPLEVCLVFVNTCTVTSKAEQKCRHTIRQALRNFPKAIVLVSGCYAQLESRAIEAIDPRVLTFPGLKKGLLAKLPKFLSDKLMVLTENGLNIETTSSILKDFFTQNELFTLNPDLNLKPLSLKLNDLKTNDGNFKALVSGENPPQTEKPEFAFDLHTSDSVFRSRSSLKIQDGCNCACSFCRIHIARGRSVSLEADEVVRRAKALEASGKNEIVLTGVNISQYRSSSLLFPQLLERLLQNTSRVRFRISSFYPEAINEDFLQVFTHKRVCPYLHLSLQSGSPDILRKMNRPFNVEKILASCLEVKAKKENIFLGCDIIVGFPGETDQDFELTFKLCKEIGFQHIHYFPFSARPGTPAYTLKPRISDKVIAARCNRLKELSEAHFKSYSTSMQGKVFFGIVETFSSTVKVLTENYLLLPLKYKKNADNLKSGDAVFVKVFENHCELA